MTETPKPALEVLIVEDNPDDATLIGLALRHAFQARLTRVDTATAMAEALDGDERFDVAICDYRMPQFSVSDALDIVEQRDLDLPCLVVSGAIEQEEAVALMESGVRDYLLKDDLHRLVPAIRRELRDARVRRALVEEEQAAAMARTRAEEAEKRAALADELERANAELKETQAQLVQAAKMASLGQLVAGIAHEINNPLAYAMSHLAMIRSLLDELQPTTGSAEEATASNSLAKCRERLSGVDEGLERVRDIVANLHVFARRDEAAFQLADIREGIESTIALLGHRFTSDVVLERRYADDNRVHCAPGAINQVVMNLLTNALDAVDGCGEIRIATSRHDGTFDISVADDGPGLEPEVREHIFEPFFTTKPVGSGMGLGLALSYGIVDRHGGSIEARDKADGGTELIVHLPIDSRSEEVVDAAQ